MISGDMKKYAPYFYSIAIRSLSIAFAFIVNIIIARYFSIGDVGQFFFFLTLITFVGQISTFGFGNWVIKNNTTGNNSIGNYISVLRAVLLISILSVFITSLALDIISNYKMININVFYLFVIPFLSFKSLILPYNQAEMLQNRGLLFDSILQPFIFCCLMISGIDIYLSYISSVIIVVALFNVNVFFDYQKKDELIKITAISNLVRKAFEFNKNQIVTILLSSAMMLVPSFLLIMADFAVFSISMKLASMLTMVLTIIALYSAPKFAKLHFEKKHDDLKLLTKKINKIIYLIAPPMLAVLIILSDDLLSFFGSEYSSNGQLVLCILASGYFVNVIVGNVGYLLLMTGNEKYVFKSNIYAFIPILTLFSININDLELVSIMIALSMVVKNLYCFYMVKKNLGFWSIGI